jgi:hypothetical protein
MCYGGMGKYTEAVDAAQWAREEFGHAQMGNARRTDRLVSMGAAVARNPGGKVSEVMQTDAARQAAYDFLESEQIDPVSIMVAVTLACVLRACQFPYVYVPIDGSSINLTDTSRGKDFGSIGSRKSGGRGLKMINSVAVGPSGVPLGLLAQVWWARGSRKTRPHRARKVQDRETRYWLEAIDQSVESIRTQTEAPVLWFQLDREADSQDMLVHLDATGHWFTVRSAHKRRLRADSLVPQYLRPHLQRQKPVGTYYLEVTASPHRKARTAKMVVRVARVVVELVDRWTKKRRELELNVVWAVERGTAPNGEKALDWCLLTNHPVDSFQMACEVIHGYSQRWRIEDFHRTWKRGGFNVERCQLRTRDRVIKWATILAANAMRIERLKHLARNQPDLPASEELNPYEIQAIILLKRRYKKRTEHIPDSMPTIAQATTWIAELGGYTGKSSGGPPGAVTIGRGLQKVRGAAEVLQELDRSQKRKKSVP